MINNNVKSLVCVVSCSLVTQSSLSGGSSQPYLPSCSCLTTRAFLSWGYPAYSPCEQAGFPLMPVYWTAPWFSYRERSVGGEPRASGRLFENNRFPQPRAPAGSVTSAGLPLLSVKLTSLWGGSWKDRFHCGLITKLKKLRWKESFAFLLPPLFH